MRGTNHGRRSNLCALKRLFNLLPVSQVANISRDLLCRRAKASNGIGNDQVDLAGVGLGRHIVASREAELLAEQIVQLVALGRVTVEDLQERGLGASGSLGATELELIADMLDALEIKHEVLCPLSSALAHCDQLCSLQVSVGQSGLI